MNKKTFLSFCHNEFKKHGFVKNKKYFYKSSKELLSGIYLQKSNYGEFYYVNYFYCIGAYSDSTVLPTHYECDIYGRIQAMSKTQTDHGKHFLTPMIEYEEYTEEDLRSYFDRAFEESILPPLHQGKKYILDNLGKGYSLMLHKEDNQGRQSGQSGDGQSGDGSLIDTD